VRHALSLLNSVEAGEFVRIVGPAFEHSPWIAERTAARRPFPDLGSLHSALCGTVARATVDEQLGLIRAHPDLVGRAVLTAESKGEQAAAGLTDLSPEEVAWFEQYNRDYQKRFGFPFIVCARQSKKAAILAAFPVRLENSAESERTTALAEIYQIARLRLGDLIEP